MDKLSERLLVDFYVSPQFDPQPSRPADTVQAAISYTLQAAYAPDRITPEALEAALNKWRHLEHWTPTSEWDPIKAMEAALLAAFAVLGGA